MRGLSLELRGKSYQRSADGWVAATPPVLICKVLLLKRLCVRKCIYFCAGWLNAKGPAEFAGPFPFNSILS